MKMVEFKGGGMVHSEEAAQINPQMTGSLTRITHEDDRAHRCAAGVIIVVWNSQVHF